MRANRAATPPSVLQSRADVTKCRSDFALRHTSNKGYAQAEKAAAMAALATLFVDCEARAAQQAAAVGIAQLEQAVVAHACAVDGLGRGEEAVVLPEMELPY